MIERKNELGAVAVDPQCLVEIADGKTDVALLQLMVKQFSAVVGVTRARGKTFVVLSQPGMDAAAIKAAAGG